MSIDPEGQAPTGATGAARVAVVQGPLHALAASAAIALLERGSRGPHANVLVIGDLNVEHHDELKQASIMCAAGVSWSGVIDGLEIVDRADLQRRLAGLDVRDVLCVRNWQPVNELALEAFPGARRIVLGDGIGVIDADRSAAKHQFDLALPVIAQPRAPDSLSGTRLEMVPRSDLEAAIAAARRRAPALREADGALAQFVSGGVLVLLSWLAETMTATLRAEIEQARVLVERASARTAAGQSCPVVIKPHPRASLGQAAALARRLRAAGHPVMVMTRLQYGHFPIEMFERLAGAADRVIAPASSSAVSLKYLYGVRADVELGQVLSLRTLTPRHWTVYRSACAHTAQALDRLEHWDGRSPLPPWLPFRPAWHHRVLDRLMRPLAWRRATGVPHRARAPFPPAIPGVLSRMLGARGAAELETFFDPDAAALWVTGRDAALREQLASPSGSGGWSGPSDPGERIRVVARSLGTRPPGCVAGLLIAVMPSSHAPGWRLALLRRRGALVRAGASRSAEEIEEVLEAELDVLARLPEPSAPRRSAWSPRSRWGRGARVPAGCVAFVLRTREDGGFPAVHELSAAMALRQR